MKRTYVAALLGAPLALTANMALAQSAGFTWEGEIEIGVEDLYDSDASGNELRDTYLSGEFTGELSFAGGVSIFSTLAFESMTDAVADRTFDDIGLFVKELGLSFDVGPNATVSIGKITPTFGRSWDAAAGFFGATLAEDYELTEQIGLTTDIAVGETGGVLSFALF